MMFVTLEDQMVFMKWCSSPMHTTAMGRLVF